MSQVYLGYSDESKNTPMLCCNGKDGAVYFTTEITEHENKNSTASVDPEMLVILESEVGHISIEKIKKQLFSKPLSPEDIERVVKSAVVYGKLSRKEIEEIWCSVSSGLQPETVPAREKRGILRQTKPQYLPN
jgi:hypothetical protein